MATLGALLKKAKPDRYGSVDEEALNRIAVKMLDDPVKKQKFLQQTREDLGSTADDAKLEDIARKLARPRTPPPPAAGPPPEQLKAARAGAAKQGLASSFTQNRKLGGQSTAPGQPPSEHVDAVQEQQRGMPTPASAMKGPGGEPPRKETLEAFTDMEALQAKHPGSYMDNGTMGFQTVLYDAQRNPLASLKHHATIDPSKVTGPPDPQHPERRGDLNVMSRIMGPGSKVQNLTARGLRSVASALGDKSADALPAGSLGFREIGGAAGHAAGERSSRGALALAKATGAAMLPVQGATWAYDRTQLAANRGVESAAKWAGMPRLAEVAKTWAEGNEQELKDREKVLGAVKDVWDMDPDQMTPDQLKEVGGLAGEYTGKEIGEWAGLFVPTEGTVLGGAALKGAAPHLMRGAKAVIPARAHEALRQAGRAVAERGARVKEGLVNGLPSFAKAFSDNPAKLGLNRELREAHDSAADKVRNLAGMESERVQAEILKDEAETLTRAGIPEKDWAATLARADAGMKTEAGLRAAPPVEAELQKRWIRAAEEDYLLSVKQGTRNPATTPFNPMHDYHGQNSQMRGGRLATEIGREAEDLGKVAPQGRDVQWGPTPERPPHTTPDIDDANIHSFEGGQSAPPAAPPGPAAPPVQEIGQFKDLTGGIRATMKVREPLPRAQKMDQWAQIQRQQGFWKRPTEREISTTVDKANKMLPSEALAKARENTLLAGGRPQIEAAEDLLQATERYARRDRRFTTIDEVRKQASSNMHANPNDQRKLRDVYGKARAKGTVEHSPVEAALRADGQVMLRKNGTPQTLLDGRLDVELPKHFSDAWNGKVVPRTWADSVVGATMDPTLTTSAKTKNVARMFDRWLGLSQQKSAITLGNPGFDLRNRMNELFRMMFEEGTENVLSKELRSHVAAISNAPLGKKSGVNINLGGKVYDTGELHTQFRLRGVMNSGASSDATREAARGIGAGRIAGRIPGLNKAADLARRPGEISSKLADKIFRSPYKGLNKIHGAEDAFRIHTTLSKMKRGQSLPSAVRDMKTLLIDYSDKNAIEQAGGVIIPFIKYYTGAARGALRIAANNPRTFSRAADFAKMIESQDAALHGGALDPRHKQLQDKLAMNPQLRFGRHLATVRNEAPSTELANLFAALSGKDEQGGAKYLAPFVTNAYAAFTGKDAVTGRSVLGLSEKQQGRSDPGAFDQWSQAKSDDDFTGDQRLLGKDPHAKAAYLAARYLPLVGGRVTTPFVDMLARTIADLGASSASKAPAESADALEHSVFSEATGLRVPLFDPEYSAKRQLDENNKQQAGNFFKNAGQGFKKGRQR